jgi:predicted nucleic acid-binding protein
MRRAAHQLMDVPPVFEDPLAVPILGSDIAAAMRADPALAGKAFMQYRRRGGARHHPLPDSYIGAHAAIAGYALLTRDARRYRTY